MFLTNVVCEGCHKYETKLVDIGDIAYQVKEAKGQACDDCHGEGYAQIAKEWQEGTRESLKELASLLLEVRQKLDSLKGKMEETKLREAENLFQRAQSNYNFVAADRSYGVHNINYTTELLDKVKEEFKGLELKPYILRDLLPEPRQLALRRIEETYPTELTRMFMLII